MLPQKRPREASSSSPPPQCSQDLNSEQNDEYISVQLSSIRKELQCPICLGILRKTRTVVECLHRFCKDCIEKSMRLGDHKCPLCRIHCPSRRSLRDDPNFDALIAVLYPDIDKYEKEELAFGEGDGEGPSKKRIQDSTAQTPRQQLDALGIKSSEKATASTSAQNVVRTRRNHPTSDHGVESASGTEFYNNLSTDQTGIELNNSLSNVVTPAGSEGEEAKKKVEELQLQVIVQGAELNRFELLSIAHEKEVDALTEELKMSTDQVSRLDQKIAELKTTNQEKDVRLQKLGHVQNENSRLMKESEVSMHKVSELEQKIAELETSNKERALRLQELEQLQKDCGDEGGVECSSRSQFDNFSADQIGVRLNNSLSDVKKALDEAWSSMLLSYSYSTEAHEKRVEEHVSKKVEELQRVELTHYKILAEAHEKQVDSLTGKLKISTDQVSRLDRRITDLETTNQEQVVRLQELGQVQNENSWLKYETELETIQKEQALRLQKLEQLQSENPQLVKECIRRLFRTKGFEDFIWKLLTPAYKYGAHRCAVSVLEHHHEIQPKVFDGKGYDPTIAEELDSVCAKALMNSALDFPLLHEIASLAEPLTLSSLKGLVFDENWELLEMVEAQRQRG